MRKMLPVFLVLFCAMASYPPAYAQDRAINFRLIDQDDTSWELHRFPEAKFVVIAAHSTASTLLIESAPRWNRLATEHAASGLRFFFVNASPNDDRKATANWAREHELVTPILKDHAQSVSQRLGLTTYGDVLIAEPAQDWKTIWRGNLSDIAALEQALGALLAGDAVSMDSTYGEGSAITYSEPADVSYSRDVAPILQERCVSCHLPGGTAPFAMSSHGKVKGWAEMIEEVVLTKRMPPWHADPAYGHFINNMAMTPEEERILLSWIRSGAEKDEDEPDPLVVNSGDDRQQWSLGKPDLVVQMPEAFDLPATGVVDYQYIHVPTGLTEDKWVRALEVQAGNRKVVHHALIFVLYPPEYQHIQPRTGEGLNGYFASFLPGDDAYPYPEGTGQFLPAGSTFVFQMHYTTTGKEESDRTRMALYFHDEPPAEALEITAVAESDLFIPPMERDHEVKKGETFKGPMKIWGLSPHMHYRGSRFRFALNSLDDTPPETLLNIPYYEFDWQPMYLLKEPVVLSGQSRIETVGAFDNSPTNPRNPNPEKMVMFGRQSFEEMYIGYVMRSKPRGEKRYKAREVAQEEVEGAEERLTAESLVGTKWRRGPFRMQFQEDGKLLSTWFAGKWHINGDQVSVVTKDNRTLTATIQGNKLYYNGQPLQRFD